MPLTRTYYSANGTMVGESTVWGRIDYNRDALGSVTGWMNQSGLKGNAFRYKPYGTMTADTDDAKDPRARWVGSLGYLPTGVPASLPHATHYVRARTYSETEGRWTTVDPLWPGEPQYTYVGGNPTTWTDPTGTLLRKKFKCGKYEGERFIPEPGDYVGIASGLGKKNDLISGTEAAAIAKNVSGRDDCIAINGGYFGPTWPAGNEKAQACGPVVDIEGGSAWSRQPKTVFIPTRRPGIPKEEIPIIPINTPHGRIHGRKDPPSDNKGKRPMKRTAACVDSNGRIVQLIVFWTPIAFREFTKCLEDLCKGSTIAYLDSGGSTQVYDSRLGKLQGGPRRVHNWIVICP